MTIRNGPKQTIFASSGLEDAMPPGGWIFKIVRLMVIRNEPKQTISVRVVSRTLDPQGGGFLKP